ncbi:TPA: ANR family transcriptional regulator [Morganella morganii]|nr:ANR family transcriptional regulator [Morganella morganii subsp. morganii]HCT1399605.1 ANR family transcriptional regulator [Morganella morganii]
MKRLKIMTDYQAVAERTAQAERTENFNQASVLWHEAWLLAASSANRRWCEAHSQLCSQFSNILRKTSS